MAAQGARPTESPPHAPHIPHTNPERKGVAAVLPYAAQPLKFKGATNTTALLVTTVILIPTLRTCQLCTSFPGQYVFVTPLTSL